MRPDVGKGGGATKCTGVPDFNSRLSNAQSLDSEFDNMAEVFWLYFRRTGGNGATLHEQGPLMFNQCNCIRCVTSLRLTSMMWIARCFVIYRYTPAIARSSHRAPLQHTLTFGTSLILYCFLRWALKPHLRSGLNYGFGQSLLSVLHVHFVHVLSEACGYRRSGGVLLEIMGQIRQKFSQSVVVGHFWPWAAL